jgi:hypothetical protein
MDIFDIIKARQQWDCDVCKRPVQRVDILPQALSYAPTLKITCHNAKFTIPIPTDLTLSSRTGIEQASKWVEGIEPFKTFIAIEKIKPPMTLLDELEEIILRGGSNALIPPDMIEEIANQKALSPAQARATSGSPRGRMREEERQRWNKEGLVGWGEKKVAESIIRKRRRNLDPRQSLVSDLYGRVRCCLCDTIIEDIVVEGDYSRRELVISMRHHNRTETFRLDERIIVMGDLAMDWARNLRPFQKDRDILDGVIGAKPAEPTVSFEPKPDDGRRIIKL